MEHNVEVDPFLFPSFTDKNVMQQSDGGTDKFGMMEYSNNKLSIPEPVKEKKKVPTWGQAWVEFTQNTTIHGLRFVWMDHAFLARKILWFLLVSACASVMAYQIVDRIIYFYSYPVTVNVNVNFNNTLLFPSITICNQNSFRATKATELGRYRLLEAMYTAGVDVNGTLLMDYNATDVRLDDLFLSVAHSKYDLIVDCQWQNKKCGPENFTQSLTDHGVCFTFNSKNGDPLFVASTGSEYGLKLTLNVEQYEYMPGPHDAAGVKMLLHDGKEFPSVGELGLAIPTGTHAYVGIQVVQIENLPLPHGNCGMLTSPYYEDYSPDNCQLACLAELMEERCGCRNHYMPHKSGSPPICTLEQYYECYLKEIDAAKEQVRAECNCPIPCDFLIFDPAISFATTSVFATDRLLAAASQTNDLESKYLDAIETTNRMEDLKFKRFLELEGKAQSRLRNLSSLLLQDVQDAISLTRDRVEGIRNKTLFVWERKDYLYHWQEYHIRKNFIRPRDAMEERTFNYLTAAFQEYATFIESQIWSLADRNITSHHAREAMYTLLVNSLDAKIDLCERAHANYTQLYDAYYNGTPIFRYKFKQESRSLNPYVTPKLLLRQALNHSSYARRFSQRVGSDIHHYKAALERFAELATEAYVNGTVDKEAMYLADVEFLWRGRRYLHAKSTFYAESIEYPKNVLLARIESFERMWREYETTIQESRGNIESLISSLYDLEHSILMRLNRSMQRSREYVSPGNVTKLEIAREMTSENIYLGLSDLKLFFQSLRARGQKIYDNWDKIMNATNRIWQVVIEDPDMMDYYQFMNLTEFLLNYTDVAQMTRDTYNAYRQIYDFRYIVGSADSLFTRSIDELMSEMETYLKDSVVETGFIRENFLQLDIFYREKSYEQITQQIAYDLFALLCDIGGSMGLFVGASVLSIGELVDLVMHQSIYRVTHKVKN